MSVDRILELLLAPDGGTLARSGDRLESSAGGSWPIIDGAPNFIDMPVDTRSDHISHSLPQSVVEMIATTPGLVLNLSAGGTINKPDNVVELEWGLYRNTDVSGDAHQLPFRDGIFDGVVCLNAFEHFRDPLKVVSEIQRVLRPGGFVYVLTAFLQPYHMKPHHYYNVTPNGLRNWFDGWRIEHCGATEFHNVMLALQWIANAALWALERDGDKPAVAAITLDDLRRAWQGNWPANVTAAHAQAAKLPQELRNDAAHALEIIARKPGHDESIETAPAPPPQIMSQSLAEEPISGEVPVTRKSVIICFDSRTGSHLLCHYLGETGLFGRPGEYFNRDGKEHSYPRHPRSQLKLAKQRSTSPDGVFCFKIDPTYFDRVAPYLDMNRDLPDRHFINLERDDLLGQAISLVRAHQTGQWFAAGTGFNTDLDYRPDAIAEAMRSLVLRRERWNLYYARNGITPLRLTFEEVVKDPIAAVSRVCRHCGIEWSVSDLPPPQSYQRQSDHVSAEWRARFLRERGDVSTLDMLP